MAARTMNPRGPQAYTQLESSNWGAEAQILAPPEARLPAKAQNGHALRTGNDRPPVTAKTKVKPQNDSLIGALCAWICDHQFGISLNLVLLLSLAHVCFPRVRRRTSKYFHLSYHNPSTGLYGAGKDDLAIVSLWVVIITGLRAAVMDYVLTPLARAAGIKSRKGLARFIEQAWVIISGATLWSLSMYLMYHSNYWLNIKGVWTGWPHKEMTGLFKWYYLIEFAFWIQQILVVNIEEKRKDYAQMFIHHIITCALILTSYGYYQTKVGNVILCLMDVVDVFLAAAKLMRYLGYKTACDITFGIFTACWIVARHVFYLMVCWSIYSDATPAITYGCYLADNTYIPATSIAEFEANGGNAVWGNLLQLYLNKEGPVCWNPAIPWSFLSLLLALQLIMILWFAMIVKVIYKVLSGVGAEDVRSDDEDGEDEKIEDVHTTRTETSETTRLQPQQIEEEVGVESLTSLRRTSPSVRNSSSKRHAGRGAVRTSGISIPGHGDHKELLGRIGCDKPT